MATKLYLKYEVLLDNCWFRGTKVKLPLIFLTGHNFAKTGISRISPFHLKSQNNMPLPNQEELLAIKAEIVAAFEANSEAALLRIITRNTWLLHQVFTRQFAPLPVFSEVEFGGTFRCDFCWLNDNSSGPEWVLVEIERPDLQILNKNGDFSSPFNHALKQLQDWEDYFQNNPNEKRRIFGAVKNFRYILIGGRSITWQQEDVLKQRISLEKKRNIEIRSSDIFIRTIDSLIESPGSLLEFEEHNIARSPSTLAEYWTEYDYMNFWRRVL
jgi:hypothetical protein